MNIHIEQPWEYRLLGWALDALDSETPHHRLETDDATLRDAYRHCDLLTKNNSRTFHLASGLLAPDKRDAARALYAFCRVTDNIADSGDSSALRKKTLEAWQHRVVHTAPNEKDPVCLAWADTRQRFNIPHGYAQQLIDGCATDLNKVRYETFDELAEYAYGVASTVGLMVMHIIGFEDSRALPYAVKLGVALQLTNILRDVAEDWRNGRLYLPLNELDKFGLNEADIANGQVDERWRAFMAFQIARNRRLYAEARPGIALLKPGGRFAIAAASDLYRAILHDIERHDYDVFSRRSHVNTLGKVARIPRIWWDARRASIA